MIEIKNLTFTYNRGASFEKKALDDVSLRINDGEFVGLIGHTGSGKSTLTQMMNALLKPDSGKVFVDGKDIHADKSGLKEVRQKVGLVFQYPEHQLFEATVAADVAFGVKNLGLPKETVDERVAWALELVGFPPDTAEKSPFDLSGGQKRRAAIAGVLAMKPDTLILDEPAAGLDPQGRDEILTKIRDMRERLGITVILVSHSMEDVARFVDRLIVMNKGAIAMDGSPSDIFADTAALERIGLSAPQAARLATALRERGFDIPKGVYTAESVADSVFSLVK